MKSKAQLLRRIREFRKITSKTGRATYSKFRIDGSQVYFIRDNTLKTWSLNIDDVYNVYKKERFINTNILKKHISGRVYSPSLAILMAADFCDQFGNRIIN